MQMVKMCQSLSDYLFSAFLPRFVRMENRKRGENEVSTNIFAKFGHSDITFFYPFPSLIFLMFLYVGAYDGSSSMVS